MRAREFINEVSPIQIQQGPDISPELRNYKERGTMDTFMPDRRERGAQDILGGPSLPRQMRAIQNTAPSREFPNRGASGATTSPPDHDTITPTMRVPTSKVKNFEPLEKTIGHPQVSFMRDKISKGREKEIPPIIVRKTDDGYEVIDGHHRLAAHQKANAGEIRVRAVDPKNLRRIKDYDPTWGYDNDSRKFLNPGFDPKGDTFSTKPLNPEILRMQSILNKGKSK